MSRIVFWQMTLGTIAFLEQLVWAATGHAPQWEVWAAALTLLGAGAIIKASGEDRRGGHGGP